MQRLTDFKTEFDESIPHHLDAFPDDSMCPECHYFDTTNPTLARIIAKRDPNGKKNLLAQARCKCPVKEQEKVVADSRRYAEATLPRGQLPKTFENFLQRPGTEGMLISAKEFG